MNKNFRSKRATTVPNLAIGVPSIGETITWEQIIAIFPVESSQLRDDAVNTDVVQRFTAYVRNPNFDTKPGDRWYELQDGEETGLIYRVIKVTPYPAATNIEIESIQG